MGWSSLSLAVKSTGPCHFACFQILVHILQSQLRNVDSALNKCATTNQRKRLFGQLLLLLGRLEAWVKDHVPLLRHLLLTLGLVADVVDALTRRGLAEDAALLCLRFVALNRVVYSDKDS